MVRARNRRGVNALRDVKMPDLVLCFTRAEMRAFLTDAADGEFDHLVE
jgi:hypothetical protein